VEIAILIDVLRDTGLPAMAQVDLGSRQNRHQPLWDLTRMSSAVLRALARRVPALDHPVPAPRVPGPWGMPGPETYLHAVAAPGGLRLDEHLTELPSTRPSPVRKSPRTRPAGSPGGTSYP
jgi:glucosyl-3-phosphoglycerate synthase